MDVLFDRLGRSEKASDFDPPTRRPPAAVCDPCFYEMDASCPRPSREVPEFPGDDFGERG